MQAYELDVEREPRGIPRNEGPQPPRRSAWRVTFVFALIALVFAALFIYGYSHYLKRQRTVETAVTASEDSLPVVNVEQVRRAPSVTALMLPGNITPLSEAYIYARASGYVRRRLVDIGDRVREGQILAEIEAPDLDQQVQQARASLAQSEKQLEQARADLGDARARMDLAKVTWDRYKVLVEHGAVSRQEGDQQLASFQSTSATYASVEARIGSSEQNVNASRANLERLASIQNFEKVRAPFAGVITARNFDIGALISGSGGSMGQGVGGGPGSLTGPSSGAQGGELFRIAQANVVRVLVNVPESSVPGIRLGETAKIVAQAYPGREFTGRITRTANAIDVSSRTMLTEIQVQNPDNVLVPGMYVQVRLQDERLQPPLLVPGDSVLPTPKGLRIAVLHDPSPPDSGKPGRVYPPQAKRIHLQEVQVGRDYGQEVEVQSGLEGWEYYVLNPGDEIVEGALVQPVSGPRATVSDANGRRGEDERRTVPPGNPPKKDGRR